MQTVAKAMDYLNNAANAKRKILLICGSCEDAATLCAGVAEIKEVDLGGLRFAEGRTSISNQVFLVEDDLRQLDEIAGQQRTVYVQEAPSKPKSHCLKFILSLKKIKNKITRKGENLCF